MLSDTERKLVRIIFNKQGRDWHKPDIEQLALRSQRDVKLVRMALRKLYEKRYIEAKEGHIRLIRTAV